MNTQFPLLFIVLFVGTINAAKTCYYCNYKEMRSCSRPEIHQCGESSAGCIKKKDQNGTAMYAGCTTREAVKEAGIKINNCVTDKSGTTCTCFDRNLCNFSNHILPSFKVLATLLVLFIC
ncbi:hypothetical protein M3Y97_01097600 [Aphelenchoides bicaudatus]|nr:hypothetical protein M3Y97_01097600 [Aphelenchoides bicaudatus]